MANKCRNFSFLTLVIACILGSSTATAQGQGPVLELGVYTPRLYFEDNLKRNRFARALAESLSAATNLPIRGRAFTQLRDLRAFMNAKRLDLGLLDIGVLSSFTGQVAVVATATSPQGLEPTFGVLAREEYTGIRSLKGRRLALVKVGPRELSLISNFALEGEIAAEKYFSEIRWGSDMAEVVRWLKTGIADCTLAYAQISGRTGLPVVVPLRGMPMPRLVIVRGGKATQHRARIESALDNGLAVTGNWPIQRFVRGNVGNIQALRRAEAQPSGRRTVRRAVWSPTPTEVLDLKRYRFQAEDDHRIKPLGDRWREPVFSEM